MGVIRGSVLPLCRRLVAIWIVWRARASQRRHLARLDDRMLRDIGISRAAAKREAHKPFWRP